jgi:hypothetical protein
LVVHTFWPLSAQPSPSRRAVRPGGGLGEELAPDLVPVEHRPQVTGLLLLAAVGDQARAEHADADHVEDPGDARLGDLLVGDDLLDRAQALAAEVLGPGDAGQAALRELPLPGAPGVDVGAVVGGAGRRGRLRLVLVQPGPHLLAVPGLLRRVVQIHALPPSADWPVGRFGRSYGRGAPDAERRSPQVSSSAIATPAP